MNVPKTDRRCYTPVEDRAIRQGFEAGLSDREIADALHNRTANSVAVRRTKLRLRRINPPRRNGAGPTSKVCGPTFGPLTAARFQSTADSGAVQTTVCGPTFGPLTAARFQSTADSGAVQTTRTPPYRSKERCVVIVVCETGGERVRFHHVDRPTADAVSDLLKSGAS